MRSVHYAWVVAAVSFVTLLAAAAFRSVPGVLMDPLHESFGWSHGTVGAAMAVNMALYGVAAPFAAALMDRFGIRPVAVVALGLIAAGTGLSTMMTTPWQLIVCWGVLIGLGTGSLSMAFVATIAQRWFEARRGLITGILTAASATGQLIFLPFMATLTEHIGWRAAILTVMVVDLAVIPLVVLAIRNYPADRGLTAFGATADASPTPPPVSHRGGLQSAFAGLTLGARYPVFWLLVGSFAICGMTTNGLLQTHFIPAAGDHGMPATIAASLLALIGVFDVVGTIASGWLTDRVDSRLLLLIYYLGRGISLALLPMLLSATTTPSTWVFILFYGLDWVATVPPTVKICAEHFGAQSAVVFGWIGASHQVGAAIAAAGAGWLRDQQGTYTGAFHLAAVLCVVAAVMCISIPKKPAPALVFS